MKSLLYFVVILVSTNVQSSLYRRGDQDKQNEYPNNVDFPSVLHKYDFDDPDVVFNPRKPYDDNITPEDDIDYATASANGEDSKASQDFERELPEWFLRDNIVESKDKKGDNVCDTEGCRKAAEEIKNNMDPTIDPCQDFDKYACGGWRVNNRIPKSNSQWTVFTKLWRDEEIILRKLIERQADSPAKSSAALVYTWYASCMNKHELARRGASPLFHLMHKLGSSPLLDPSWWSRLYSWSFVDQLVLLNQIAIHPFFVLTPSSDLVNSSRVLLSVSPAKLLLRSPRFYLQHGKYYKAVRRAYLIMMIDLMKKLSGFVFRSFSFRHFLFARQIGNIFKLEKLLALAKLSSKTSSYRKMTLKRLQLEIPEFPWRQYILKLYKNIPQEKPITYNEIIAVHGFKHLKKIFRILRYTLKSVTANYFMWNVAYRFTADISPDYETIRHRFIVAMYGQQKRKARWRECVSSTSSALSMAVGKLFVEARFNKDSKKQAEKIIEDIRQQLIKDFEEITWMDSNTTRNAKEKANAIVKNIGYPKFILNETLVRKYYKGMHFKPDEFLGNIIKRRIVISHNALLSREKKPSRERWDMPPQEINAYYSLNLNKIVFPAGILQPPFWDASYPIYTDDVPAWSLQYGGLAFIVGHEITHGFDASGMHYDKNGNYIGWWTNSSTKSFKSKSHCLQEQYSHYKLFGKNINGNLTLSENIADNAGIRLAFKAYKKWLKEHGPEKKLPGLPFSNEQLFFLKGAQIWCANLRRKATLNSLDTDVHSPKIFRIIGPFSNCDEFSKAFKCSHKCRMNPAKKCAVW